MAGISGLISGCPCAHMPNQSIIHCCIATWEAYRMSAPAQYCLGRTQSPYALSGNKHLWWILKLAMKNLKPVKIFASRGKSQDDITSAFRDYLDGYFNSFDYHPTCTRHIFSRNDAFALWSDFLKISDDLSFAAGSMISSPERFMNLESLASDELAARKRKAAARAAEILTEQFSGPTVPDRSQDST